MKQYEHHTLYRGQQITKVVCAKSDREAAEKLGINIYHIRNYCFKVVTESAFDGVLAFYDSGFMWRECKDMIRVKMPLNELVGLIDRYKLNHGIKDISIERDF